MSGECKQHFSSDECLHNQTVDDEREGNSICISCGLVLQPIFLETSWETEKRQSMHFDQDLKGRSREFFFRDLGANAHICESITHDAGLYYDKIKNNLKDHKPKFNDNVLAAYALYETLSKHKVSRSVQEIEYLTGSKPGKMFAVESALNLTETLNCPLHFVSRFCSMLQLSFIDETIIRNIVKNATKLKLSNMRSQCTVAVIIQLFCKEKRYKITLKKICEICGVSPTNIHTLIRKMDKMHVTKITDFAVTI